MVKQQDYFEDIFPELAMENLKQGMTHQVVRASPPYNLLYLMPENDIWKDKAMALKGIYRPKFVASNADARKKFILDECKFHWLDPESAEKLATKYNNVMSKKDDVKVDLAIKQLIWIIEAAKQRYIETVGK